jgi:hypothetical protein
MSDTTTFTRSALRAELRAARKLRDTGTLGNAEWSKLNLRIAELTEALAPSTVHASTPSTADQLQAAEAALEARIARTAAIQRMASNRRELVVALNDARLDMHKLNREQLLGKLNADALLLGFRDVSVALEAIRTDDVSEVRAELKSIVDQLIAGA